MSFLSTSKDHTALYANTKAFFLASTIAVSTVEAIKYLRKKNYLSTKVARKMLHISIGPLFLTTWPLFQNDVNAKYFAAAIPTCIVSQFILVGSGIMKDVNTVQIMSRSGNPAEILKGPILYGLVFISSTILYWRSLIGAVALSILCAGDGFAAICGEKYPIAPLPWNKKKSVGGSLAFALTSIPLSMYFYFYFNKFGWISKDISFDCFMQKLLPVTAIAMLVESLPIPEIDNLTVFGSVMATYKYLGGIECKK
eukprot:65487_1